MTNPFILENAPDPFYPDDEDKQRRLHEAMNLGFIIYQNGNYYLTHQGLARWVLERAV